MNLALYAAIVLLFAAWTTVHVQLCLRLMRKSFKRGLIALFVPPLAPYWGQSAQIRKLPAIWMVTAMLYLVLLIAGMI